MDTGPVDVVIFEFPGNKFNGDLLPALREVAAGGAVRILDILFVIKDADGNVSCVDSAAVALDPDFDHTDIDGTLAGEVLDAEDAVDIAAQLEVNSSAALIVFENTWAARFASAVTASGGRVVDSARVPASVIAPYLVSA